MKQFFAKHKAFFMKCLAFIIALSIMGLCVLLSFCFSVPVKAESVQDQFEDYVDDMYFEGASAIISGIVDNTPGLNILAAVMFGCEFVEVNGSGVIPVNTLTTCMGYYHYNDELHICTSTVGDQQFYDPADGGILLAKSPDFQIYSLVTPRNDLSHIMGYRSGGWNGYWFCSNQPGATLGFSVSGGGSIFPSYTGSTSTSSTNPYESKIGVQYKNTTNPYAVPFLTDNLTTTDYVGGYNVEYIAGGFGTDRIFNWSDMGFDNSVTIDPSNVTDFVINVFNPYIEENYPDLVTYLFYPAVDPTEDTTECTECGGCNCVHNITVNVEPTVNVEVNVEPTVNVYIENQFPSDWIEDYTTPSYPVETLPIPSENVTMPTSDLDDELTDDVIDGLYFWRDLWTSLVWASDYFGVIAAVLLLAIAEWCIWHIGR